jgi:dihydrofolate synthase/folylpolyglutamate synthase
LNTLDAWLVRLEQLHPSAIDLGLERVRRVKDALGLSPSFPVITVGGTNGKGSTCAYLEAILAAAGYRTGLYTSPHLLRYNERVRVAGVEAGDAELVAAFERVDAARGEVSLTYFEFGTLGAMLQFVAAQVDVAILEVGLGGRLDAVNVFEPDAAIVTGVDLDHMDYLGESREKIGFEKAGIYRASRPAICSDPQPPTSLLEHAGRIGANLYRIDEAFHASRQNGSWSYRGQAWSFTGLPLPAMPGAHQLRNAAAALAALETLQDRLPVSEAAISQGLLDARVAGRFQCFGANPQTVLDVAHNPQAAHALAGSLLENPVPGRTLAVVGMLADKDAAEVIDALAACVDAWWVCRPDSPRTLAAEALAETVREHAQDVPVTVRSAPLEAYRAALSAARDGDRILVFGSFYTVASVLAGSKARTEAGSLPRCRLTDPC